MPLFLRSSPSKKNLSAAPALPPPPPAAPQLSLGSPFQLSLPFAPARSDSSDSGSTVPSSSSGGTGKLTSPTSEEELSASARSSADSVVPKAQDGFGQGLRSRKSSSGKLRGLFSGRKRSGSKGSVKAREEEKPLKVEQVPPVPALPPTLGLFELPLPSLAPSAPAEVTGLPTPAPEDPDSVFAMQEGRELADLLFAVHAAGDAVGSRAEEEKYVPPQLVTPPTRSGKFPFRTPELVSPSSSSSGSLFSSPSSVFSSPATSGSPTPKPFYSFPSRNPAGKEGKRTSLLSPFSAFTLRASQSLLTPPTTPPPAPKPVDDGEEDDYGAASASDSDGEDGAWQKKPNSSFARRGPPPPLLRTPSPSSASHPSPSPSPVPRSPRRRPLGPRATKLLSLTVGRLSPAPTSPSSTLAAPLSTHPSAAVRAASNLRHPQPLARTLGRLALLRKLKRGTTMLEAMELEVPRSSTAAIYGADKRASVVSRSARLSIASEDSLEREYDGAEGRRSLEMWEAEHGRLDDAGTVRSILAASEAGGQGEKAFTPAIAPPAPPFSAAAAVSTFPRLALWAARAPFPHRMLETRVVLVAGMASVLSDIVCPSRVGSGRARPVKLSARVGGMLAALGEAQRPARERETDAGLPNSAVEAISPALRAAAAGAAPSPMAFGPETLEGRRMSLAQKRTSTAGSRGGPRKLLLPGPLLLKALAEAEENGESVKDFETSREESSDEDDRPLFHLAQRASLLPPRPLSRSPSRSPARSPSTSPAASQTALIRAQQKAARLEAEVERLRAREAEARQREEDLHREHLEREALREMEIREKEARRRMEEQRRRSRIMHSPSTGRGEEKRASGLPAPANAHRSSMLPLPSQQQQQLLAVPSPYMALPVPMAVPMPFYQLPLLSTSQPELHYQRAELQRAHSPQPYTRAASPSPARAASRQSVLPSRPGPMPLSPPRSPQRVSFLSHSASNPNLPRSPSSPHRSSPLPPPPARRQSTHPLPPLLPHSASTPTLSYLSPGAAGGRTSHRASIQPFLVAGAPAGIRLSRSHSSLSPNQASPRIPVRAGGAAFLAGGVGKRATAA
ncbi:hypothetical protein JCM10213_009024 [Rhodosporidiobolus nylandii]